MMSSSTTESPSSSSSEEEEEDETKGQTIKIHSTRIQDLDPKKTVLYLKEQDTSWRPAAAVREPGTLLRAAAAGIWTVEQFLTLKECDEVIAAANLAGFDEVVYEGGGGGGGGGKGGGARGRERLLSFDRNGLLLRTLQSRLRTSGVLRHMNDAHHQVQPYGFCSASTAWFKNNGTVNECVRVGKHGRGFEWHRDAQYTKSPLLRSNYTLVVFLNDATGRTVFRVPSGSLPHSGQTIREELDMVEALGFADFAVEPRAGRALVFDQRLLHCSEPSGAEKYVLRTDLLCAGTRGDPPGGAVELETEVLAKKLFRQAQFCELTGKDQEAGDLYERCISLRQAPHLLTEVPVELSRLLSVSELDVSEPVVGTLTRVGRSGYSHRYAHNGGANKMDLLQAAVVHAFLSMPGAESPPLDKVLQMCGIDASSSEKGRREKVSAPVLTEDYSPETNFTSYAELVLATENFEPRLEHVLPCIRAINFKDSVSAEELAKTPLVNKLDVSGHMYAFGVEPCPLRECADRYQVEGEDDFVDEFGPEKVENFTRHVSDLAMHFDDMKTASGTWTGKIHVTAPSVAFNHASCQRETYAFRKDAEPGEKTALVTYDYAFVMTSRTIRIEATPVAVL